MNIFGSTPVTEADMNKPLSDLALATQTVTSAKLTPEEIVLTLSNGATFRVKGDNMKWTLGWGELAL